MYTSLPRTLSWISQRVSPDENLVRSRRAGGTPRNSETEVTKDGWEFPPRMTMLRTMVVGDGWMGCGGGEVGDDDLEVDPDD